MKKVMILMVMMLTAGVLSAQKTTTASIKTSAECGDCKERIEEKLNYTKGVVFAELDVETKVVTVKFKNEKVTLDSIKKAIAEVGYDADEVKANPEKQKLLPLCCQPNGMKNK